MRSGWIRKRAKEVRLKYQPDSEFRDHLSTTDESGKRVRIYPARAEGRFARARTWMQVLLVGFFLALPWLTISGKPFLQLNFPERKFYFLGRLFLSQDLPMIFFYAMTFLFGIGLVTILFGRAWCGWACPQTVFVDGVFRRIEAWVEGDHVARRALDRKPFEERVFTKALKWSLFALVSLVITHSFVGVFLGGPALARMMMRSPVENLGAFLFAFGSGAFILFNFGWFREQFCLVACPYGRFQSVMTDPHTLTVGFNTRRIDDCVNCRKCVIVCPTGIDIRNGNQMECIGCTACADACDSVMAKLNRPLGLVGYGSEVEFTTDWLRMGEQACGSGRVKLTEWVESLGESPQRAAGGVEFAAKSGTVVPEIARTAVARPPVESVVQLPSRWKMALRPRAAVFAALFLAAFAGVVVSGGERDPLRVEILRGKDLPYQVVNESGQTKVLNHLKLNFHSASDSRIWMELRAPVGSSLEVVTVPTPEPEGAWTFRQVHSFLKFPKTLVPGGAGQASLIVAYGEILPSGARGPEKILEKEVRLVGPAN